MDHLVRLSGVEKGLDDQGVATLAAFGANEIARLFGTETFGQQPATLQLVVVFGDGEDTRLQRYMFGGEPLRIAQPVVARS